MSAPRNELAIFFNNPLMPPPGRMRHRKESHRIHSVLKSTARGFRALIHCRRPFHPRRSSPVARYLGAVPAFGLGMTCFLTEHALSIKMRRTLAEFEEARTPCSALSSSGSEKSRDSTLRTSLNLS
ncbi:hypothetical protein BU26DRAFT_506969 [Trematosphaeria pertusa]|uniref:Uncharacterized protein n=1 Tax=Trematosphaeria pertusa TaxID=390896 RepID=A0A6A6IBN5_9PLEO|nr:uncharacterized protein BU26DRAFT_506969 [Trematosphaeria pertusa]KAF2247791.1 hypothetical protein BU26DRAFT_506969 [Trematosphaeria pertusa]